MHTHGPLLLATLANGTLPASAASSSPRLVSKLLAAVLTFVADFVAESSVFLSPTDICAESAWAWPVVVPHGSIILGMARPVVLSGRRCYHCGSDQTSKAGWGKTGKKRYKCRMCRKFFIEGGATKHGKRQQYKMTLPSREYLLNEIRRVARELGRPPTTTDWAKLRQTDSVCPLQWFYAVFGSWLKAVKLAGLKPNYLQEFDERDRERMLRDLSSLSRKLGRPIIGEDVFVARKRKEVSPINHFQIAFGTVPEAIAAAGVGPHVEYSRDELKSFLRKLDATLDRPVQKADIQKMYDQGRGPSVKRFINEFGTLTAARRAAGIRKVYRKRHGTTVHWQKYRLDELVEQLKNLGERLGRKPTDRDINAASKRGECASATTFASMFGSLVEAYKAAGYRVAGG